MLDAIVLALTGRISSCSWDNPGADPYIGPVPAAIQKYKDIPKDVRDRLQSRMDSHQYDDIALITRDRIQGQNEYTNLRMMHFGNGNLCRSVSRFRWKDDHQERGLVYCEDKHCIIVPTVCRNVSQISPISKTDSPNKNFIPPDPPHQEVQSVPEPGTLFLVVLGLIRIVTSRWCKNLNRD